MKKLLGLIFFAFVVFVMLTGTKRIFVGAKSFFSKYKEEIVEEDLSNIGIERKKEVVKKERKDGVMVPSYWKKGVSGEEDDHLKGYIPSIKFFQEYISTKDSILYGNIKDIETFSDYKDVVSLLKDSKTILVEAMVNENKYFDWSDENCAVFEQAFNGENVFVCNNWVNWMKREVEGPVFVLTECKIGKNQGKCVFLDYSSVYLKEKTATDTRCISKEYSELCGFEKYSELIKYR